MESNSEELLEQMETGRVEGVGGKIMTVSNGELNQQSRAFVNAEDGLTVNLEEGMEIEEGATVNQIERERELLQLRILEGELDQLDLDALNLEEIVNEEEFPSNLIVTGLQKEIFEVESELRGQFEDLFRFFGNDVTFHYFKSFRRARVTYPTAVSAVRARVKVHLTKLGDSTLKCFFGQVLKPKLDSDGFLHPPTPDKQFLISPPSSPPDGWQPVPEAQPRLNFDLVTAITTLRPGETHELHTPEVETQPAIVVHVAPGDNPEVEDEQMDFGREKEEKVKIQHTRRPEVY